MFFVLVGFLAYHLRLAVSNNTTNESFKRSDFNYALSHENRVLKDLIAECEKFDPKVASDGTVEGLPPIRVDGVLMPEGKKERMDKYM